MNDPNVEKELQEFLAWQAENVRKGITPEALSTQIEEMRRQQHAMMGALQRVLKEFLVVYQTQQRHGRRIQAVEHQVSSMANSTPMFPDWHPDPREITGTYQFNEIQRQVEVIAKRYADEEDRKRAEDKRREEEAIWWTRQKKQWGGGIIVALAIATLTACGGWAYHTIRTVQQLTAPAAPHS